MIPYDKLRIQLRVILWRHYLLRTDKHAQTALTQLDEIHFVCDIYFRRGGCDISGSAFCRKQWPHFPC